MAFCAPCRYVGDDKCISCSLTDHFTSDSDMLKLRLLTETFPVSIVREKVLDLKKTDCAVDEWVKTECDRCSVNKEMERRISDLEVKLELMMKGDKKLSVDQNLPGPSASKDEVKKLLKALEAHVEKGLSTNLQLWSAIRFDQFHGTNRSSVGLKDLWRTCEDAAKRNVITSAMESEDIPRILRISIALEGWRKEKVNAALANKLAKEPRKVPMKVAKEARKEPMKVAKK